MDRAAQEAWIAQWRSAAIALAGQRARELGDLTGSGLVRQQELFHRHAVA